MLVWFFHIYIFSTASISSGNYWASVCVATYPIYHASYVISVRETRDLTTSFRFRHTTDTLKLRCILPTIRVC